jgi:hypothetical protein
MAIARRDTRKLWLVASAFAATLCVLTAVRASAGPYDWAAGLPGCDRSRPAVAHYAGGVPLNPQPTNGPVPCGVLNGWPSIETRIEVTNRAVVQLPALLGDPNAPAVLGGCGNLPGQCVGNAIAVSADEGAHWQASVNNPGFPDPMLGGGPLYGETDNNFYVDHVTDRLFWYLQDSGFDGSRPNGGCGNTKGATIFRTDDSGTTWLTASFDRDHGCTENPTVLTAKPRISTPSYPGGVVYLCGNNTGDTTAAGGIGSTDQFCSKSLDGGATWLGELLQPPGGGGQGAYSGQLKDTLHPYPQCANGASSSGSHEVQPLPDGTLLVVLSCGGNTYLSESRDEGASWQIRNRIPSGGSLRADSVGNLYKANGSLLSTSTDGGVTWSQERDMVAPGVTLRSPSYFAQGINRVGHEVGRVAFVYYGHRAGQTTDDGFITETRNALDPNPVFWSGQVNSPTRPLLTNAPGVNMGLTVLDFAGGAFSPDGRSVWGAFVRDCGTSLVTDPNCTSRYPNTHHPQDGFAGRLVWQQ